MVDVATRDGRIEHATRARAVDTRRHNRTLQSAICRIHVPHSFCASWLSLMSESNALPGTCAPCLSDTGSAGCRGRMCFGCRESARQGSCSGVRPRAWASVTSGF
eukprot:3102950-Rhodomonas_salina.3